MTLRFPGERLAQFSVSYGLDPVDEYTLVGDKGGMHMAPAYKFPGPLGFTVRQGQSESRRTFPKVDQFGGETAYFSDCILKGEHPEPDGEEGRLDVRVLSAIERALSTGRPVTLEPAERHRRPAPAQARTLASVTPPRLVRAAEPAEG